MWATDTNARVKKMATILETVEVVCRTSFVRTNIHAAKPFDEMFVAITMKRLGTHRVNGKFAPRPFFVTFTRHASQFGNTTQEGDKFVVSGKVKRHQTYEGLEATVLTNCVRDAVVKPVKVNSRAAKINKMLGLA
jgi:hypothetical protein